MKLVKFNMTNNYIFEFEFEFENKFVKTVDLSKLIKSKVTIEELQTAHLDKEWGCLEFKNGMVDISPKTLYNFVNNYI